MAPYKWRQWPKNSTKQSHQMPKEIILSNLIPNAPIWIIENLNIILAKPFLEENVWLGAAKKHKKMITHINQKCRYSTMIGSWENVLNPNALFPPNRSAFQTNAYECYDGNCKMHYQTYKNGRRSLISEFHVLHRSY